MAGMFRKSLSIFFIVSLFLIFLSIFTNYNQENAFAFSNSSSTIVMRQDTLEVLYGTNFTERKPMASTTKIMTALLICENCNQNEKVTIPKEAVGIEGSSVYLKEGEELTVKELLYCLMLRSGNDSAVALALYAGKNVEAFVEMMNIRAKSMGLKDTHFENPHGLHNDNHYTTCYDLCLLACNAMDNGLFKEIVSTKSITVGNRFLQNKNKFLLQYDGANGIKTGYTSHAGRCLVSSASKNGIPLVAVCLNVPDMFEKSSFLMDKGYQILEQKSF